MTRMNKKEMQKERQKDKYLYKTYGLTIDEWKEMSKDGCWICGRKEGRLNVDHRHVKNYKKLSPEKKKEETRGCLCFLCNVMIGKLERRRCARWLLQRTVAYFHIYRMFGDE